MDDPLHQPNLPLAETTQTVPIWERLLFFGVACCVLIIDQLSKLWIEATFPLFTSVAPLALLEPLVRFSHVPNHGTALGLFQGGGWFFAGTAVVVGLIIIWYNFSLPTENRLLRVALGMQLGGAWGNLLDRLRQGYVTDFLAVGPLPIFNVADVAIVAGVGILGLLMVVEQRGEYRE